MSGHHRQRTTQRSPTTPISPKGGSGTAPISLSLLLSDAQDIASSSLRELAAVALATNVTVFMERGTKLARVVHEADLPDHGLKSLPERTGYAILPQRRDSH